VPTFDISSNVRDGIATGKHAAEAIQRALEWEGRNKRMTPAAIAIATPTKKGQRLFDDRFTSADARGCVVVVITVIDGDAVDVLATAAPLGDGAADVMVGDTAASGCCLESALTRAAASRGFEELFPLRGMRRSPTGDAAD
jgi:hypothetical protein